VGSENVGRPTARVSRATDLIFVRNRVKVSQVQYLTMLRWFRDCVPVELNVLEECVSSNEQLDCVFSRRMVLRFCGLSGVSYHDIVFFSVLQRQTT